jgi:hypothetical protein
MKSLLLVLVFSLALVCAPASRASSILVTAAPTGTDSIDWSQFGPVGSLIDNSFDNPFPFTTTNSVAGTGTWGNGSANAFGAGQVETEGNGWVGNFQFGATLNYDEDSGPLTLIFAGGGYTQIGAQVQPNSLGAFVAQICDIDGCFTEGGTSTQAEDNSAIYIGVSSSTPINSVTFSMTSVSNGGDVNDFAISNVTLNTPAVTPSPVPESPTLLYLLLAGLCFCGANFLRSRNSFRSKRDGLILANLSNH